MKKEVLEKRTLNSKTFENENGTFTLETHTGHIHYLDRNTGKLEDIKNDVVENGQGWEMRKAGYEVELPKTSKGAVRFFVNKFDKDIYSVRQKEIPKFVKQRKFNGQDNIDFTLTKIAGQPIREVQGVKTDHHQITYPDVADGIDLVLSCGFNSFRKEIVIKEMPEFEGDFLEIEFATNRRFLTKVKGRRFQKDNLYFRNPIVSDARGETEDIEIEFGWNKLVKRIPREFLEKAVYPVITDTTESYYAGAGDGDCKKTASNTGRSQANWDEVQDATVADSCSYTGTENVSYAGTTGGNNIQQQRGFLPFDTSGLPDNAVISDAVLYLHISSRWDDWDTGGNDYMAVIQTGQVSGTELVVGDYDSYILTEGSDQKDLGSIGTGNYESWTLNATGRGWISKTGYTMLAVAEGHIINDDYVDMGGADKANGIKFRTSEYSGTASDPYLEVTYTAAPAYQPRGTSLPDPAIY